MLRRLLSLALVLGLLVPALSGVVAAKGGRGKSEGIKVQSVSYDAGTGELTTTVRWHKGELKKDGRDAMHVVVYHDGDDPQVLSDQTVDATFDEHIRTHRITLSPEQRETAGDGRHLVAVVTHKHDDGGGLFERVWHHSLPVDATARDVSGALRTCTVIQPYANLSSCWFSGANLAGADLRGVFMTHTYLANANLSGANLTGANLSRSLLDGANLTGTIFCNTTMPDDTTNNASC